MDSSGGAGLSADLRTFAALGVHGACAVASLTAQNSLGVQDRLDTPAHFLAAQVQAVTMDMAVLATKTGMLGTAENVSCVAGRARSGLLGQVVVDPVLISSSGCDLLDTDGPVAYVKELLPYTLVLTPNRYEAGLLSGVEVTDFDSAVGAARCLAAHGPAWVVIKGGHSFGIRGHNGASVPGDVSMDLVFDSASDSVFTISAPRVDTGNDRGTGCTLSAAIASYLALGLDVPSALRRSKQFVAQALIGAAGWRLGASHGPLDQMGWVDR